MNGQLFWITGLAGAGKSSVGRALFELIRGIKPNILYLDGDTLRDVFDSSTIHDLDGRHRLAMQYARLCRMVTEQGVDVVCATISMFEECRRWNRQNTQYYREIYLRVPLSVLVQRDQKQLYSRALSGNGSNVIGVDLPFDEPKSPDMIVENDGTRTPEQAATDIFKMYFSSPGRAQ